LTVLRKSLSRVVSSWHYRCHNPNFDCYKARNVGYGGGGGGGDDCTGGALMVGRVASAYAQTTTIVTNTYTGPAWVADVEDAFVWQAHPSRLPELHL